MRATLFMFFFGLGWILRIVGGLVLIWALIYGLYALFAKSVVIGLLFIGGVVVGGWIIQIASGLLFLTAAGVATVGKNQGNDAA